MPIKIKTPDQIQKMRRASLIVKEVHDLMQEAVRPGITTIELDKIAATHILNRGAAPSFLGYNGFPANICVSINEEVIHGIPSLRKLKEGDIVSIDVGAFLDGYHGDAARTYPVGEISPEARRLIDATRESFFEGMKYAKVGCRVFDVSAAISNCAHKYGYSVVEEYLGHGVGREMHEEPQIPNYRPKTREKGMTNPRFVKGMTIAVEPMINMGGKRIELLPDKWTVVTVDKKLSAHYENTLLITDGEPELLTARGNV